jgi:hypothetical protein
MSYIEAVNSSGGTAVAAKVLLASHIHLHVVLVDLRSVRPGLSKEERKIFVLQDLSLNVADITDVSMGQSTQLLQVGFDAA